MITCMHRRTWVGLGLVTALLAGACSGGDDDEGSADDPGDCLVVDVTTSPEKADLMNDLADDFNGSDDARLGDDCLFARVQTKASGRAEQLLAEGWDEDVEGPRPVLWTPAASTWGAVLDQHLQDGGGEAVVPDDAEPFMLSPLVIAMPRPMAEALGWPDEPVGWSDILNLARDGQGWASHGHPEWGRFRLGKTNPNFSTSGLAALVAQAYAATGKTSGLSLEDLDRPEVGDFAQGVESSVVHYGDTTLTFLENWYRADRRGNPFQYVSAVAVEEKSVVDYNTGNPDGTLESGEEPRPPREQLVAIYPEEGTIYSDHPLNILDAEWVDEREAEAAQVFVDFLLTVRIQERVREFGFRPANPDVEVGDPISEENGVDPATPETLLEVPSPEVLSGLLDDWAEQRKSARVLLVIDVSGSMGDPADPDDPGGPTKLDLAKEAAAAALEGFKDDDQVGLWIFSTDLDDETGRNVQEILAPGSAGENRERLRSEINGLVPVNGTPLYEVTDEAYQAAVEGFDEARINAVVLLSDGVNDDGQASDDDQQLEQLVADLSAGSEGVDNQAVRIFPIAYGGDADMGVLRQIAEATTGAVYDASDATTIDQVLTAVVSNF
jgi:Ca-activated chloride channel homolog